MESISAGIDALDVALCLAEYDRDNWRQERGVATMSSEVAEEMRWIPNVQVEYVQLPDQLQEMLHSRQVGVEINATIAEMVFRFRAVVVASRIPEKTAAPCIQPSRTSL